MKKITKYQAKDGREFNDELECIKHDAIIDEVTIIMAPLNPLPKKDEGCRFANGGGYIQQDLQTVIKARKELCSLGNKIFKKSKPISFRWLGRYLDDSGYLFMYCAWTRLSNIDNRHREWGQGYYAINPDKGKQIPFIEKG